MSTSLLDKKILKTAEKALSKYKLCNHCLGRLFAKVETNITNQIRGKTIRAKLIDQKKIKINNCELCSGLLGEIYHFADIISESLSNYEFETFLIGSKVDEDIIDKERELIEFIKTSYSETIKTEINRETGKILEEKLGKEVDFEKPSIMVVIDTSYNDVSLQIASLYVYGRYKKFSREIPQTKWFCKICRGKGCKKCNYTGKLYDNSVEELIAEKILKETKGSDESFHGSGREDVDVRMLGNGRPFVIEIINPRIRDIDLAKIKSQINNENKDIIEVFNLRFSNKKDIFRLKDSRFKKTYRIIMKCDKSLNNEKLKKVTQTLRGSKIGQLTPSRVAHRRADLIRERYIYNCNLESVGGTIAILTLEAESGTYIKELVSGDNGRTKPSMSDLIGAPCKVTELDVIEIKGE